MKKKQYCNTCETETIHDVEIIKSFANDKRDDTQLSSVQMIARCNEENEYELTCAECGISHIEI